MTQLIKRYLSLLTLIFSIFSLNALACADGTILTTTEEFNFKQAPGFNADETYSQVWHFKDSTYLVWVDVNYRAQITQIKAGKAITVPLDENPDYLVQQDGHHRFSLGVDKLGYVHVTGDMHNYTDMTTGVITPYPARYQNQKILYWRSNTPGDITGKFSFRGGSFDTAMNGSGWMMGRFFTDNNGELFYSSHVQAFRSSNNFGQMGVGLYKYNTITQAWATLGGIAPVTDPNVTYVHTVLYWEYSGFLNTQFQNYQPVFKFDKSNNMYFALTGNTNPQLNGANRLMFAKSENGGLTWKRANGTALAGLPIRGISGLPNSADIILDTGTTNFLDAKPGLNIDTNGKPGVEIMNTWRVWDGSTWSVNTKVNYATMLTAETGYRLPNNDLIFNATSWNKLLRTTSFDNETIGYDFVGYNQLECVDDFAIKTYGEIYGVGQKADNEAVLKTTITSAPLPTGWLDMDIDTVFLNYKGNAGFLNNSFVLTTYGQSLNDQTDSLHFAYKKMRGDGQITAKLTKFALANGSAGVMMRETLDANAKDVSQVLFPLNSPQYSSFLARQTVGAYPLEVKTTNILAPYWLRLNRTGNTFTGFISPDGVTWKQTYATTVSMASDIYVGLASTAGRQRWFMDGATFESVSAPADVCVNTNPTVTLSPATQSGSPGATLTYALTVLNNDPATCPASNFTLSTTLPSSIAGKLDVSTLSIAPGATASTNLQLTSSTTAPVADYNFSVKATNGNYNGSVSGTYTVKNSCILSAPTITLSPSSKTTSGLLPVYYIATITSNDSTACPQRVFSFSADSSNYYLKTLMEPYNINMVPGQTSESELTLTPVTGLSLGTYTPTVWTQNGGSAKATLIYQAQPAVIVQVTSNKTVYTRRTTPTTATFTVSVLENNKVVANVPIVASLTWPTGTTNLAAAPLDSGTRIFNQVINSDSALGNYTFTVTANYKGQSITNNVIYLVR